MGKGFVHALGIFDLDPGRFQSYDGGTHGQTMIVMGIEDRCRKPFTAMDDKPVIKDVNMGSHSFPFGGQVP